MSQEKAKHIWIFMSSYGIVFATTSWLHESIKQGLWWKGIIALVVGFVIYRYFVNRV